MWPPHSGDEFACLDAHYGTHEPELCSLSLTPWVVQAAGPVQRCVGGAGSTYSALHLALGTWQSPLGQERW